MINRNFRVWSLLAIFMLTASCFLCLFTIDVQAYTGTITYSSASNTVTAVGGTSGTPITFNDLYLAVGNSSLIALQSTDQYLFNCKVMIGDGTNTTYFTDSNKQITFSSGIVTANYQILISLSRYSNVQFGTLINATLKQTQKGCQFTSLETTYRHNLISQTNSGSNSSLKIYSSDFNSLIECTIISRVGAQVWNCHLGSITQLSFNAGDGSTDIYNIIKDASTSSYNHFSLYTTANWNKIHVAGAGSGFYTTTTGNITITNLYSESLTKLCTLDNTFTGNLYFINPTVSSWVFNWGASSTGKIYRQYEYDLTVLNGEITDFVENANVTLTRSGSVIGSWLTNSSGQIPSTTQTYGYYNQANGNNIQGATDPFILTVTHPDWANYTSRFYITEKTKMTISMQEAAVVPSVSAVDVLEDESSLSVVFIIACMVGLLALVVGVVYSRGRE